MKGKKMKYEMTPFGVLLTGEDIVQNDSGFFAVKEFIDNHKHDGWSLSIYDTTTNKTVEIDCPLEEIPKVISYIYNLEHAHPILFVGENIITDSYVVGMPLTRGRIKVPGIYKAINGKLIDKTI